MIPNVAFDVDGILANFSQPFRYWVKEMYGIEMIGTGNFNWATSPEIPEKAFKKIIAEFFEFESDMITQLVDGYHLVRYVYDKTASPITFVTARHISGAGET
jgi:hypothetical protein